MVWPIWGQYFCDAGDAGSGFCSFLRFGVSIMVILMVWGRSFHDLDDLGSGFW